VADTGHTHTDTAPGRARLLTSPGAPRGAALVGGPFLDADLRVPATEHRADAHPRRDRGASWRCARIDCPRVAAYVVEVWARRGGHWSEQLCWAHLNESARRWIARGFRWHVTDLRARR